MKTRKETKNIKIGSISIGGQDKVLIQSMCNIKTSKTDEVIKQINDCASLGADLMRVSVLDMGDALAIKEIKANTSIPLVADIHFDYSLAITSIESGADKIRINPGNIGTYDNLKKVIECAKKHGTAIRIGVNSGSLEKEFASQDIPLAEKLFKSALKYITLLEQLEFYDIVVSLKASNIIETIKAYELMSEQCDYPLHLGITEAGIKDLSLIRSTAGLTPLLLKGIGDTIRISITDDSKEEIKAAKRLLHDLGLYPNYPTIISCPTCGRTQVDVANLTNNILNYLETVNKPIKIAIMGCVVNGPGEAKDADIGVAGGKNEYVLFAKGQIIKKVSESKVLETLIDEINKL